MRLTAHALPLVITYQVNMSEYAFVCLMSKQGALTFWTAAFPGLTRHLPEVQESAKEVQQGSKRYGLLECDIRLLIYFSSADEHAAFESLSRNRVSNISFTVSSVGEIFILVVMVGILEGMKVEESTENNTKAFSVLIAFSGAAWCK